MLLNTNTYISQLIDLLTAFAAQESLGEKLALVFGVEITSTRFLEAVANLPEIEVYPDTELQGASGAFSGQTGKIYLSESIVNGESRPLIKVLLEEIGHYLDFLFNGADTPGDEGAIFAAVVLGETWNDENWKSLRAEDDSQILLLGGEVVEVEQATFPGSDGNDNITGTDEADTINSGRGIDNIDGGQGDDLLVIDYSSNNYGGNTSYPAGISSAIYDGYGAGALAGYLSAYINNNGAYDQVSFSNIEKLQITGTPQNDTIDRGGYESISVDGGEGIDTINYVDLGSFTTDLVVDNSGGGTFTSSNGTVVKNVERFANLITGTGNDTITFTGRFNETINTGDGDDTINGGLGIDRIDGGEGDDLLIIDYSSNSYGGDTSYLAGINSNIYLLNGAWDGHLSAYINNTGAYDYVSFSNIDRFQITGTSASDDIKTGGGDDVITGVNPNSSTPGLGEIDILRGGAGADKFILGELDWIGYDDSNGLTSGDVDYALIVDFDPTEGDVIQLRGTSSDYLLKLEGADTQILIDKPGTEPDEVIAVLQNITALGLNNSYFKYISENPPLTLAIATTNAVQTEGNSGTTPFSFTVTRTGDTNVTSAANWGVTGTGTNPANAADFGGTLPTGTVTFVAGETSQVITVNVSGDTVVEPEETFTVTLSNPSNATITTATATGTIRNDDTPPVVSGRQQITSSDNLTAAPRGNVSIPLFYNTSNGDNTLTGISLRLHYNSNELNFQTVENLFNNNLFVAVEDLADSSNLDKDPQSDRYVQFGYTDFGGNWPNQPLPLK
ncbi:Calx-beta domain-containing protein, partial [Umezakia ovalisporum]|uniref:Calx-beta domain-containing protein n=2 Tax=Umezakia ovalisporum TaxID=75695 RepID=UPI0035B903F2